jgi:hypothetical protein
MGNLTNPLSKFLEHILVGVFTIIIIVINYKIYFFIFGENLIVTSKLGTELNVSLFMNLIKAITIEWLETPTLKENSFTDIFKIVSFVVIALIFGFFCDYTVSLIFWEMKYFYDSIKNRCELLKKIFSDMAPNFVVILKTL